MANTETQVGRGGGGKGEKAEAKTKVAVPSYTKGSGTKVNEHTRRPPGKSQQQQQQQPEKQEKRGRKTRGEEDTNNNNDDEGEGDGDDKEAAAPTAKKPSISVREFLAMPWTEKQEALVNQHVSKDTTGQAAGLVMRDNAINKNKEIDSAGLERLSMQKRERGQRPITSTTAAPPVADNNDEEGDDGGDDDNNDGGGEGGAELGYDEFMDDFDDGTPMSSDSKASIMKALVNGKYHEGGEFGKRCLVPHLAKAGLYDLSRAVQQGKYKF